MLNFNKLCVIVYEIFNNSQLFLTDPRNIRQICFLRLLDSIDEIDVEINFPVSKFLEVRLNTNVCTLYT